MNSLRLACLFWSGVLFVVFQLLRAVFLLIAAFWEWLASLSPIIRRRFAVFSRFFSSSSRKRPRRARRRARKSDSCLCGYFLIAFLVLFLFLIANFA